MNNAGKGLFIGFSIAALVAVAYFVVKPAVKKKKSKKNIKKFNENIKELILKGETPEGQERACEYVENNFIINHEGEKMSISEMTYFVDRYGDEGRKVLTEYLNALEKFKLSQCKTTRDLFGDYLKV